MLLQVLIESLIVKLITHQPFPCNLNCNSTGSTAICHQYYSSIINTTVAGTTISTSSRLDYRWLNSDRSWMFGVNAGYDSRPMATGAADTGGDATNSSTVFYQQVAAGLEAVSNTWNFNAYALIPVGTNEYRLNSNYLGGALDTNGLDVGYAITPDFKASVGYYYQDGDLGATDSSGVLGRFFFYNISNGLTAGHNLSYDQAFETRFSADLKYRFGSNGYGAPSAKKEWKSPVIQALTENVKHRDVRVHDLGNSTCGGCGFGETGVGKLAPDPEQPIGYQGAT